MIARHPLIRHGTHQRERILRSLIPSNFRLDERDMADLLAFVAKFSEQITYYNLANKEDGNWSPLWSQDTTMLFAVIAASDLEFFRVDYRNTEIKLIQQLKLEDSSDYSPNSDTVSSTDLLKSLVEKIYAVAKKIGEIYLQVPDNQSLKKEIASLIAPLALKNNDFSTPLEKLIAWHKGTENNIETKYEMFFSNTWNLDIDKFHCVDYVELSGDDREALWQLFLAFYKALVAIVQRAEKAFQKSLNTRSNHQPNITLLLSFLSLFRHLQKDLNDLTERHLRYYYQDILRLQAKKEIPDRAHLVFEIAQNINSYLIEKDTLFVDGKDSKGLDRLYALEEETTIHQVALLEKKNLYFYKAEGKKIPIALPFADKKDGWKEAFADGAKAWGLASGKLLWDKHLLLKQKLLPYQQSEKVKGLNNNSFTKKFKNNISPILSSAGLIISSPELWLAKGTGRSITISGLSLSDITNDIDNIDNIEISTSNGLIIANKDKDKITLNNVEDAIAPFPLNGYNFEHPYIIIKSKNYITDLLGKQIDKIKISTTSTISESLEIRAGGVNIPPDGDIVFVSASNVYIATIDVFLEELKNKNVNSLSINGTNIINPIKTLNVAISFELTDNINLTNNLVGKVEKKSTNHYQITVTIPATVANNAQIYKIPRKDISLTYTSDLNENVTLYHYHPFTGISPVGESKYLINQYQLADYQSVIALDVPKGNSNLTDLEKEKSFSAANMMLGFENLQGGQVLSLLFKMAEGTGNPEHLAPEIIWSYLSENQWIRLPQQYILKDETNGLGRTGIVKLLIPSDITNKNTLVTGGTPESPNLDLFWLQISAAEYEEAGKVYAADALPLWEDVFVNAATAVFENQENSLEHINDGLPPNSITQARFRDINIKSVKQPFKTFDGRISENQDSMSYFRRVSERLRHRQRAVTVWDYERLLLEKFSKVAITKCIPHTDAADDVKMPGHVLVAVIPYPEKMTDIARHYYPSFDAGDLAEMKAFLSQKNSAWVSGIGFSKSCCCEEKVTTATPSATKKECCCDDDEKNNLEVLNAHFEPIRIKVCVRFYKGKDIAFYKKQLNEDLKRFLAPWAMDKNAPLLFGASIYKTELLRFLENLDYVDVITNLQIKHFATKTQADINEFIAEWSDNEIITPFTPRSVLTTYLDILNEDNPNVIDHQIDVIEDFGDCGCKNC